MKRYVCVKGWARNKVGDMIDESVYRRYPVELRNRCFELYTEEKTSKVANKPRVTAEPITTKEAIEATAATFEMPLEKIRVESSVALEVKDLDPDTSDDKNPLKKNFKKNL